LRESRFAVAHARRDPGPVFDEVLKWLPYKELLVPIAHAVYSGITWLIEADRAAGTGRPEVIPAAVVADVFARALRASGSVEHIVTVDREPVGDARRMADVVVRLGVPAWGLVRVRDGTPALAAVFADVRVEMTLRETGVVLWAHEEDVTHPERFPLETLIKDKALTSELLLDVLQRAGRRVANELVYARGGAT
jgi:hypothetical protein